MASRFLTVPTIVTLAIQLREGKETPDLMSNMNRITDAIPMMDALERKIPQMEQTRPALTDAISGLDDLADMSDMEAAREGGKVIQEINEVRKNEEMSPENKAWQVQKLGIEARQWLTSAIDRPEPLPVGDVAEAAAPYIDNAAPVQAAVPQAEQPQQTEQEVPRTANESILDDLRAQAGLGSGTEAELPGHKEVSIGEKLSEMNIRESMGTEPANWSDVDKAEQKVKDDMTNPYREGMKELDHKMSLEHNRVYEPVIWKTPTESEGITNDIAEAIRVKAGELEQVKKNKVEYTAAKDAQVTKEAIDYAVGQGMRFDE